MFIARIALAIGLAAATVTAGYGQAHTATLRRVADHGYLGVGVIELTDERVKTLGLKDSSGVEVMRVEENSPAAKAGIMLNDVILKVNGKTIGDMDQFIRLISESPGGAKVNLTVWRSGGTRTLGAVLDARQQNLLYHGTGPDDGVMPPMPALPPGGLWDGDAPMSGLNGSGALVGFEGETLTPQLADFFGVKAGVLVRTVGPKTPAERAGLKAGDVVVKVNGTPVSSPREISGLVRMNRSKTASFAVVRNRKEITLNVEISAIGTRSPFTGVVDCAHADRPQMYRMV